MDRAVHGGERQRGQDEPELGQQQAAVGRTHEPRDVADVGGRQQRPGGDEHEDGAERHPREAPRGEDGVGARIGAALVGRGPEQQRQRQQAADPHAGADHVKAVERDRPRRRGLDGRRVARGRDRHQGGRAQ